MYSTNEIKSKTLWNNRCIVIDKNPFNFVEWYGNGIVCVNELQDKNYSF